MRTTIFTLDPYGDAEFDGYRADEQWNGWACPYFTREQAMRIVNAHNMLGHGQARYDEAADCFIFSFEGDEADAQEVYSAIKLEGREFYPVGTSCWIWEEISAERVQSAQIWSSN